MIYLGVEGEHHVINDKDHPVYSDNMWNIYEKARAQDKEAQDQWSDIYLDFPAQFRQDWYQRVYKWYISERFTPAQNEALVVSASITRISPSMREYGSSRRIPRSSDLLPGQGRIQPGGCHHHRRSSGKRRERVQLHDRDTTETWSREAE